MLFGAFQRVVGILESIETRRYVSLAHCLFVLFFSGKTGWFVFLWFSLKRTCQRSFGHPAPKKSCFPQKGGSQLQPFRWVARVLPDIFFFSPAA